MPRTADSQEPSEEHAGGQQAGTTLTAHPSHVGWRQGSQESAHACLHRASVTQQQGHGTGPPVSPDLQTLQK